MQKFDDIPVRYTRSKIVSLVSLLFGEKIFPDGSGKFTHYSKISHDTETTNFLYIDYDIKKE